MTELNKKTVEAAIVAITSDTDESQIDELQFKPFGSGFRMDFGIDNVEREEGGIFNLDQVDGASHVTVSHDNESVTQLWGHMILDEDEMDDEEAETWSHFRPAGYSGQLHLIYHMRHYAGEYSDDESDANADVTMCVVGEDDLKEAVETVKSQWRKAIGESALSKITEALSDVMLLEDEELMRIADSAEFSEINRRIASIMR